MKAYHQLIVHTLLLYLVSSTLVGCGYQLRGAVNDQRNNRLTNIAGSNPLQSRYAPIYLKIADNRTSKSLTRPLKKQLSMLGYSSSTHSVTPQHSIIAIDNLNFREFELVGVLTEVRVVIMADVTYNIHKNGQMMTHKQPVQIERSYQYNEASVSVDQQGEQIKQWLYEALATRITDQYVALSMQN